MQTLLKFLAITTLILPTLCCTNSNNKPSTFLLSEEIITYNDTSSTPKTETIQNNIWEFKIINNEDIDKYIYESSPFLVFSIDSSYIFINSGCNTYLGECQFEKNQKISFDKINIKDEICPIDALEREIIYMLDITSKYSLNNNNLTLYNKSVPIGLLSLKKQE